MHRRPSAGGMLSYLPRLGLCPSRGLLSPLVARQEGGRFRSSRLWLVRGGGLLLEWHPAEPAEDQYSPPRLCADPVWVLHRE